MKLNGKKYYLITSIIILIIAAVILGVTLKKEPEKVIALNTSTKSAEMHWDTKIAENQWDSEIKVYTVGRNIFRRFIKDPSINILNIINESTSICSYKKSISKGRIEKHLINKFTDKINENESGNMRIGPLPVYSEFIDYMSSKNNIENYLSHNGVNCNVSRCIIIEYLIGETFEIPVTAWLETDKGNYFITIEPDLENPQSVNYMYSLYTQKEYYEKYKLKDGTLKVNDKDITRGNYVKFENKGVYLPFEATLEKLGAKITWATDKKSVLMKCKGKKYIFKIDGPDGPAVYNEGEDSPIEKGEWWTLSYQLIDNKIVMDNRVMEGFVSLLGGRLNINYEKLTIEVNN